MSTKLHTVEGRALSAADRDRVAQFNDHVLNAADLPDDVRCGLAAVLGPVADGLDVAVVDTEAHLTPNEAAKLVGVSRPLFNQLLDEGRIAFFETPGGHRKIKLDAVCAFIEERDAIAEQLAAARADRQPHGEAIAEELGLGPERAKRLGFA